MFWLHATLTWLGFAVLAVALGTLRVLFLEPLTGEPVAHVLGTLALCALLLVIISWFVGRFMGRANVRAGQRATDLRTTNLRDRRRLLALGLFWTALTIAFEFGFGHYVLGHPWQSLLADYNLPAGRVWVLVLLTLYFGPRLVARMLTRARR